MPLLTIPSPVGAAQDQTSPGQATQAPALQPPAQVQAPAAALPLPPPLPSVDPRDVSVQRQNLGAPPLGVLPPERGGFPATLWAGLPAAAVAALLPQATQLPPSPALHDLARRLLLSAAATPADATPSDRSALAEVRVSRLLAMGEVDGARQLAESVPAGLNTAGLARLRWQAQLLSGHLDDACAGLGAAGSFGDGEIAEGQALCQLAAGNTLAGNLSLDVLRDRKPADTSFIAAAEVLAGLPPVKGRTDSLKTPTPLQFAAFRAAKLPLPQDALDTAGPPVLAAMASSADIAPDQRLAAAERAEALGVVATDTLRQQVAAQQFGPEDLAQALAKSDGMAGPRALALLARAAEAATDPAVKAPLLARALALAAPRGRFATAARLLAPQIATLPAQPALAGFAPAAARALLVAGKPDAAKAWLDLAATTPDGAKAAARLWPLARVYGLADPSAEAAQAWVQAAEPHQAVAALALLSGLGLRVPETAWLPLLALPREALGPRPAVALLLPQMAAAGRLGGTVLAVLASFDPAGLDKADPVALAQVTSGLKAVGLEAEARRLAVDVMLADGV